MDSTDTARNHLPGSSHTSLNTALETTPNINPEQCHSDSHTAAALQHDIDTTPLQDIPTATQTMLKDTSPVASVSAQTESNSAAAAGSRPIITLPPPPWSALTTSPSPSPPTKAITDARATSSSATLSQDSQVEQYKDDLMMHTQLQLQVYLEDLEEAEAEAHVQAAIEASLHGGDPLDPLSSTSLSASYGTAATATTLFGTAGLSSTSAPVVQEVTAESFQQQMLSLESTALAAVASATSSSAAGQGAPSQGRVEGDLHDLQEGEEGEMDDDDEECLPPSETKYILYDDHVSPVSIAQALVILNGDLYEDYAGPEVMSTDDHRRNNSHSHFDRDGNSVLYSGFPSSRAHLTSFVGGGGPTDEDGLLDDDSESSPIRRDFHGLDDGDDGETLYGNGKGLHPDYANSRDVGYGHYSSLTGMLSPPTASKSDFISTESCDDENLQGRPGYWSGPDISLNLAGNVVSPIAIHDLFFSRYYSRLVYLNLWDTNLGTWGAQAVGGLMADRACRVEYLNLGCNRLGFEGIVQLWGTYKNSSLVELDLSENQLGPKAVHTLQQIMVRLQKNKACNIRRLNLSNNVINDVGCISIAKIILGSILTHLDLSFNKISDWGASTILAAFESNDLTLRDINMEANPMSYAGGVDICKILALPQSRITHLDLRGAKVTDVGVPYLAEALKSHSCPVVSLNLYDCQLTDTGILKLAIKLSVNKSLRVLGLGCNCIGDMGILALSQGLMLNNYLEELDLSENDMAISRAGMEALISVMRSNTSLLDLRLDVDGHPHAVTRSSAGSWFPGFESGTEYQHQQLPHHQQRHQQQQPQTIANSGEMLANTNSHGFMVSNGAQVGEVLAPTHAALAQPLLVPALATPPSVQNQAHMQPGLPPLAFFGQAGLGAPVLNEQQLEQERKQLNLALTTLKTYVRHNYKRTGRMRRLCFEILAIARVLLFAKDAPMFVPSESRPSNYHSFPLSASPFLSSSASPATLDHTKFSGQTLSRSDPDVVGRLQELSLGLKGGSPPSVIPMQTGLPTPPLAMDADLVLKARLSLTMEKSTLDSTGDKTMLESGERSPAPRATLACLPWEIKEMILRALDTQGLLSGKQFQAIMKYSGSQWETTRQPWERWGEIREMILEKTLCYYYEP